MGTIIKKKIDSIKTKFTTSGQSKVTHTKSFNDSSISFVSHDYSDPSTWFFSSMEVIDELATTIDNLIYSFATDRIVIDLDKITDRLNWTSKKVTVKKNDIEITSGYTLDLSNNVIIFDTLNDPSDVITISYSYENGSEYCLIAAPGKKLLVDYVESQFSALTQFNDTMCFELVLNNPNVGNVDVAVGRVEYKSPHDFLNKGNNGSVMEPFGGLLQKINIFPWNYLTGYTIKPVGDATTDPTKNEFNKIRMRLKNDLPYTNCEIATGTFYCLVEDL